MKFGFIVLLFIVITVNAKASTDTLITKLINTIYTEVVNSKAKFYYLYEFGKPPKFDKYDLLELKNTAIAREIPFSDFIESVKTDTIKTMWNDYNITKAKVVLKTPIKYTNSYRIINYLPFKTTDSVMQSYRNKGIIPVRKKSSYSARRLKIEQAKAIEQYDNSFPIEEKNLYSFTKPIFSRDKNFVLIGLNNGDCGCLYIFKLINGGWIKLFQYKCWVA
jgi:hypothetical protein